MNVAFYYHALPPVDDMLTLSTPDDIVIKPSDLVEGWKNSEINAFIVVGVTDKQIRELYAAVKKRADAAVAQMKKTFKSGGCEAYLKRLYRFDTGASAKLYVDFLTTYLEEDFAGNIDNYGFYEDSPAIFPLHPAQYPRLLLCPSCNETLAKTSRIYNPCIVWYRTSSAFLYQTYYLIPSFCSSGRVTN